MADANLQAPFANFDPVKCAHAHLKAWVSGEHCTARHEHFSPPDLAAVYATHDAMASDALAAELGAFKYIECSAMTQVNLSAVFTTAIMGAVDAQAKLAAKRRRRRTFCTVM